MDKKLIVITGASSGIGKICAIEFSKLGYPTLLLARNVDAIPNLDNSIKKSLDVTDYDAFKSAIIDAEEIYGKTDLLINNAGVMLLGNIEKQNPNEWQTMLNVNIMGVLNGMQAVLNDMKNRNCGTIVNVSSIAGKKTFGNHAAYCATKFGVHALSENVREEISDTNVRVCVIAPGVVETNLLSHVSDEAIKNDYQSWKDAAMDGKGMDPLHIFESINFIYQMPQNVCIRELVLAPTTQQA